MSSTTQGAEHSRRSGDEQYVEASSPFLGKVKINSTHLNTIISIISFAILCTVAFVLYAHGADSKDSTKSVAAELKEANKEVALTLKESNKEVAKVLFELSTAMRESNCLAQFSTSQDKARNSDLCKRLSR